MDFASEQTDMMADSSNLSRDRISLETGPLTFPFHLLASNPERPGAHNSQTLKKCVALNAFTMLLNLSKSIVLAGTTRFTLGTRFTRDITSSENGHSANFPPFGSRKIQGPTIPFELCSISMAFKLTSLHPLGIKDT